jgi:hypothetical protein
MSSLLKGGTVLLVSACFAAPSFAQSTLRAEQITVPIKDAGILRMATGTWDRSPGSTLALGSETIFNNNAPSGYFNPQDAPQTQIGEGRVPSSSSEGTAAAYTVNCWQIAYCTNDLIGPVVDASGIWYNDYSSCSDPQVDGGIGSLPSAVAGSNLATGMPGTIGIGTQSCWIVTIDLSATSDVFTIGGDTDGTFDNLSGNPELDSFGWAVTITNIGVSTTTGLLIAGDPNNAGHGAGTDPAWGFAPGPDGTGLDEVDQFWITDTANASNDGCYWFGGYPTNSIWGGHWHQLQGDDGAGGPFTNYCPQPSVNSTGGASTLTATGSGSISANDLVLTADSLPSQPGIFIAGPSAAATPLFCGNLCIGFGGLQRFTSTASPAGGVISVNVDYNDVTQVPGGLNVIAGASYFYQRWNRDPAHFAACGDVATFSSAVQVLHTP